MDCLLPGLRVVLRVEAALAAALGATHGLFREALAVELQAFGFRAIAARLLLVDSADTARRGAHEQFLPKLLR